LLCGPVKTTNNGHAAFNGSSRAIATINCGTLGYG